MTMKTPPYDVDQGLHADRAGRQGAAGDRDQQEPAVQRRQGPDRARQGQPGQADVRDRLVRLRPGHLSTELLKRASGIDYLIVPYKGSAPAYQDLIGGRIDGFIDPILGSSSHAKAGR